MNSPDPPVEISVSEAKRIADSAPGKALIIDVREPDELQICSVQGARHIPMRQIPENLPHLPKDQHLLIMCHHGGRSMRVTQYLRHHGFENVSNIAGGIDAWAQEIEPGLARY
jgi:adenylyltransferase/sulfurtransferase